MAYADLRDWLSTVDKQGELLHLAGVSHDLEMAGIAEILAREGKQPPPAILYRDIPGHAPGYRTLFGMLSSPWRLAMALGLPLTELEPVALARNWRQKRRGLSLIPPRVVNRGPVQEHVLSGTEIDLCAFPSPRFHEWDGGRYLGTGHCVITRDPESGWVNLGTYRVMLVDRDRLALHMLPTQQGDMMLHTYRARKEPMPVAIALGVDPTLLFAGITRLPWGVSEYDFAGGLRGEPVEVIKGPATGLPIPARAEIVVEGECLPGEVIAEGPFGEWHGYYANQGLEPVPEPVIRVRTVLHRAGLFLTTTWRDMYAHLMKNERNGKETPCAVVIGCDPPVPLASVARVRGDELAIAGALRGEALEVVTCETNDLEVPAHAEIVIEGYVPAGVREPEGPFGEYTGYMGAAGPSFVIEITAMTHRTDPIYQAFFSQMPPSESSCIRGTGRDVALYQHLTRDLRLPVRAVHLLEAGGGAAFLAVSVRREHPALPQRIMWAVWAYDPSFSKWVVVVDEDIDIRDYFQVLWAMSWHVQPARDLYVNRDTATVGLDPSLAEEDVDQHERKTVLSSKVGVDATRKHKFPARSIPPQVDLDRVDAQWSDYGLE